MFPAALDGDLELEALANSAAVAAVREPVVLLGIEPSDFFAVALPDVTFLRQPELLVGEVPYLAVLTQSGTDGSSSSWHGQTR